MSMNLYARLSKENSHKLVQLTPDLLEALQHSASGSELKFKAFNEEKSDVVLCSKDKTWLVKQKNHSNTVLLMREFVPERQTPVNATSLVGVPHPTNDFLTFARTTFEYEVRPTKGLINVDALPLYDGEQNFPASDSVLKFETFQDLLANSPSSEIESVSRWHLLGGCLINGYPCILSADFLSKALHVTLMSVMAESLDLERLKIDDTFEAVSKDISEENNPYTKQVIETVLSRFGVRKNVKNQPDIWKLNREEIATWYGIRALRKYASSTSVPLEEFLINWKSTFPPFSSFDIDIKMLRGWYFQPALTNIQFISKDTLPMNIKDRFRMLFKLQSQWELEDIAPFVEELNTKGAKIDTFMMKYARKRRVGKKSIICSR